MAEASIRPYCMTLPVRMPGASKSHDVELAPTGSVWLALVLPWFHWQQLQSIQNHKPDRVGVRDLDDGFRLPA